METVNPEQDPWPVCTGLNDRPHPKAGKRAVARRANRCDSPNIPDEPSLTCVPKPNRTNKLGDGTEVVDPLLSSAECDVLDVEAAMNRSSVVIRPKTSGPQNIVIFTLNSAGLRAKYKKESLRALAHRLQFTIGVITETNLLKQEADALQIPGYRIIDDHGTSKHRGGVLIMAKTEAPCRKVIRRQRPPDPINTCSVLISPTGLEEDSIQVAGIYIPPSALAMGEQLSTLVDSNYRETAKSGEPFSHLLIGDFNPNCWRENERKQYHEWVTESGLWDLADPALPTFIKGSSLDKMLLCPGRDIPEEWLGAPTPKEMEDTEPSKCMDRPFYPARVFPEPWVADHHPLQLTLSSAPITEGIASRVLKISDLTPEDWQAKDTQFQDFWDENSRKVHSALRYKNPTRLLDLLYQGLRLLFAKQMRAPKKKGKKNNKSSTDQCHQPPPFQIFCKRHRSHPDYPKLIAAAQRADAPLATRIMSGMSRDGWRDYLAKVHPSDVSAFFRYLAREDGRQPRQNFYSCMAPLKDPQGVRRYDPSRKCTPIADHLQRKLAISAASPGNLSVTKAETPGQHGKQGKRSGKPVYHRKILKRPQVSMHSIPEPFEAFSAVEVYKAVHSMSKKKASGPDGFMAEAYQNLPGVLNPLRQLFNLILNTGRMPLPMLRLHIVPLEKPQEDPEECGSKRPISLLNTTSKILESLVLTRMINDADMNLDERQYAYRPHRGAETHLIEFHDFVREAYNKGESIYVSAVDVDSAFDNVPHKKLVQTAVERNIAPHICRCIEVWLKRRIFSVRLTSPTGRFYSNWRPIGQGVPQGGVLSPYLWLLHIDKLFKGMENRRQQQLCHIPPETIRFLDSLYADDILCAIAHKNLQTLEQAAHVSANAYADSLGDLGLAATAPKSENFIISRNAEEETLFRRNWEEIQQHRNPPEGSLDPAGAPAMESSERPPTPAQPTEAPTQQHLALPYTEVAKMKILGAAFDREFSLNDHYSRILEKARIRMSIIARLSGQKWGLETRMLRLTGQSLAISLLRYGFVVTGSGMPDTQLRRLNTLLLNPLARRIVGVGPSARLSVLFAMAGILNSFNLFIQQCSETLNLILRASGSSARRGTIERLGQIYEVPSWTAQPQHLELDRAQSPLIGYLRFLDYDVEESWMFQLLTVTPRLPPKYWVRSVYHADAKEIGSKPNLLSLTYTFQGASSWLDIAVQTLTASGWRPDCTVDSELDLTKILPPRPELGKIHVSTEYPFIPPEQERTKQTTHGANVVRETANASTQLTIYAGAFYQEGFGASVACFCPPDGIPRTQSWGLGFDLVSKEPPTFVLEASVLHALLLAETLITRKPDPLLNISILAGTKRTCLHLANWQRCGKLALESAAAEEIVKVWHRLNKAPLCGVQLQALPWTVFEGKGPWDSSVGCLLKAAAARFFQTGIPLAKTKWGERIARIPWTTKELKRHLKRRYRDDERAALELLAMGGSIAGANYCQMGLNRAILKETLRRLHHNRRHQVVLANIVCATRFKFFDETGSLLQVRCPNGCGNVDSLDHLLECHNMGQISPESTFDEKVSFLSATAVKTARNCPALPTPIPTTAVRPPLEMDELSLTNTDPSAGSSEATEGEEMNWALEFDTT